MRRLSPLGKGFLTGTVNPATEFAPGDIRGLNTTAARIGVRGNRYNDHHMGLAGR